MDESSVHDVVKQQSEGDASLPDDIATSYSSSTAKGEVPAISNHDATSSQPQNEAEEDRDVPTAQAENTSGVDGPAESDSDVINHQITDSVESQGEGKGHTRTASVKKPAAFKAVSVTKNFLAKAAGGPLGTKSGEKPGTLGSAGSAAQATQRPRLVAKSGSGLREAIPQSSAGSKGIDGKAQPEAGKVWNKNRPTQPSAPKQFTDEELKQQYGIHLATRLQTDEGKEAKWADIDDDDEDWAPDTIEWNDGTKITLPTQEEPPPMPTAIASPPKSPSVDSETVQAKPAAPKLSNLRQSISRAPTTTGSRPGSLVLKGAAEKATLVAKPLGPPTPVRSPWAQLPPVEKLPPISINPQGPQQQQQQQQQQQSRFQQRDSHGFEGLPPPPAKEIAADDFNRSWRDSQSNSNRELFNSQSGRYEPVSENRRGSVRNEQHFRQPSVLQRPSPTDSKGPAEPSAAFQTSRSAAGVEGSWNRRRASSNLSGGSGNIGRRMSIGKVHDLAQGAGDAQMFQRRGSQAIVESPGPSRELSPALSNQRHSRDDPSSPRLRDSAISPASEGNQSTNMPNGQVEKGVETPDPVVMQKEIMRQAREQARQRRKELEETEEAAKKERIRLKLQSLGAPSSDLKKGPPQETAVQPVPESENQEKAQPPKPPIPETSGEVRQYGMMKLHHPETVRHRNGAQSHGQAADNNPSQARRAVTPSRISLDSDRVKEQSSATVNGISHLPLPASDPLVQRDSKMAPNSADNFMAWAKSGISTHSAPGSNLWGPPSNDKALGNGTFDSGFGRVTGPSSNASQQLSPSLQATIGPLSTSPHLSNSTSSQNHQDIRSDPAFHSRSVQQPTSLGDSAPIMEQRGNHNAVQQSRPGPIAPPGSAAFSGSSSVIPRQSKAQGVAAWGNFAESVQRQEAEEGAEAHRRYLAQREEEAQTGIRPEAPVVKETWRQVQDQESTLGQRNLLGVSHSTGQMRSSRESQANAPQQSGGYRGSRFFPNATENQSSSANTQTGPRSDSPPPPETNDHPAADGDRQHPNVSLPIPKPRVRFPPREATAQSDETQEPSPTSRPSPERVIATTANAAWQDRFNGLFGRKQPSPPKSYALAVNSTANAGGDDTSNAGVYATVSLPKTRAARKFGSIFVLDDSSEVTSKASEDALLGEPEFGSLPAIKIPKQAPQNLWHPARAPPSTLRSKSKFQKQISVISSESIRIEPEGDSRGGTLITIHFPGALQRRNVLKPRHAGVNNVRHRQTSAQWKEKRKQHPKPRDISAAHSTASPSSQTPKSAQGTPQSGGAGENRSKGSHTPLSGGKKA